MLSRYHKSGGGGSLKGFFKDPVVRAKLEEHLEKGGKCSFIVHFRGKECINRVVCVSVCCC